MVSQFTWFKIEVFECLCLHVLRPMKSVHTHGSSFILSEMIQIGDLRARLGPSLHPKSRYSKYEKERLANAGNVELLSQHET